jgi:hypothetical protein
MWKLKDFAEGKTKKENLILMKEKLLGMKKDIPCIKSIQVGIDTLGNGNYDIILVEVFENKEGLYEYKKHPKHIVVDDFITKVREERKAVDFEE